MLRKDSGDWVKGAMIFEVEGVRDRGRPRLERSQVVENGRKERGMARKDAKTEKKKTALESCQPTLA